MCQTTQVNPQDVFSLGVYQRSHNSLVLRRFNLFCVSVVSISLIEILVEFTTYSVILVPQRVFEIAATIKHMSRVMRKPSFWFSTRSDTNQAVQPHKMARGLKFRIKEVEGLYYPCSENKDADQLRGYREADLRLCFRICKKPVFSRRGIYIILNKRINA